MNGRDPFRTSPLKPDVVRERIDAASVAAARRRPVAEVLEVLDTVVAKWLAPASKWRSEAEERLSVSTGFSLPMLRHALPLQLAPLRRAGIEALLARELEDLTSLDATGQVDSLRPPAVIVHVLAGNLPLLAAAPLFLSLALGSAVVLKPGAGDPESAGLLLDSLAEVDADLAARVVVLPWRGGDETIERAVFETAEVVVAQGSDDSLAAIATRVPGRFVGHGHRISFAAIARQALSEPAEADRIADRLALDVSLWDQQGCLSPQIAWVERGGPLGEREWEDRLAAAVERWSVRLPPRRRSLADEAAILRFRQEAEWRPGRSLRASPGSSAWSLSIEMEPGFRPSCLDRCLRLQWVDDLSHLPVWIAPGRPWLEAAGVAFGTHDRPDIRSALQTAGVHRICPLGTMQEPDLSWRPGGRPRVRDWFVPA